MHFAGAEHDEKPLFHRPDDLEKTGVTRAVNCTWTYNADPDTEFLAQRQGETFPFDLCLLIVIARGEWRILITGPLLHVPVYTRRAGVNVPAAVMFASCANETLCCTNMHGLHLGTTTLEVTKHTSNVKYGIDTNTRTIAIFGFCQVSAKYVYTVRKLAAFALLTYKYTNVCA